MTEWVGFMNVNVTSNYSFILASDDGAKLVFNNMTVYYNWSHNVHNITETREISPGIYPFSVTMYQGFGDYWFNFDIQPKTYTLSNLTLLYKRYDPTYQRGTLLDSNIFPTYETPKNLSKLCNLYSGFILPMHSVGIKLYSFLLGGRYGVKLVVGDQAVFKFDGGGQLKDSFNLSLEINMTAGEKYKFELYYFNDYPTLLWKYDLVNYHSPPAEAYSNSLVVDESVISTSLNLSYCDIIIQGDLTVGSLYFGSISSSIIIEGNLIINDSLYLHPTQSYPPIQINRCISGTGSIIIDSYSNTSLLQYNCDTTPNLPVILDFNYDNDTCSTVKASYSRTILELNVVMDCVSLGVGSSAISLPWYFYIVVGILGLVVIIGIIYYLIRKKENQLQINELML